MTEDPERRDIVAETHAAAVAEEEAPEPEAPELEVERAKADEVVLGSQLDDVIRRLRQPPAPEAVKFKIQTNPKDGDTSKKALIVAYVDARFCADRLNIVAPGLWSEEPMALAHTPRTDDAAAVLCKVKLSVPTPNGDLLVSRVDVGTSSGLATEMGVKALYSDAFKRACVKLGIGAVLYAAPKIHIRGSDLDNWGPEGKGHKFALSDANLAYCRNVYARFVKSVEDIYGQPLSHGDAEGGQGDIETEHPEQEAPASAGPPFGEPAGDELVSKLAGALGYLFDGDLERAAALQAKLTQRAGGYMPQIVAAAVGFTAAALKEAEEAEAAAAAQAELDAQAAEAAGADEDVARLPGTEPPAEAPAAAESDTGGSDA